MDAPAEHPPDGPVLYLTLSDRPLSARETTRAISYRVVGRAGMLPALAAIIAAWFRPPDVTDAME